MCSFQDILLSIVNPRNFKVLVLLIWVSTWFILIFIGELGFDKNWTQFVLVNFKVNELIENYILIDSRISFKAITSSLEFDLQHNMLVSSTNKIGFNTLFIDYGKSLM
jgi:hypothetical protein